VALRAFLATRLAPYEVPNPLRVVDRLPTNNAGKVLKGELARLFGKQDGSASGKFD
jgi:acyl-coenzyme A synthetase/AMP-(fatty) acid ligase